MSYVARRAREEKKKEFMEQKSSYEIQGLTSGIIVGPAYDAEIRMD